MKPYIKTIAFFMVCAFVNPFVIVTLMILGPLGALFTPVETNVYRMYIPFYLPASLVVFSLITLINYQVYAFLRKERKQTYSFSHFFPLYLRSQKPYFPFVLLQIVWIIGMEGNVFAFLFVLPALGWGIFSFIWSCRLFLRYTRP